MKRTILIAALSLFTITAFGQSKPDTTRKYTLSEAQAIQLTQILSFGDMAAGNSDKISTRDYNAYHAVVMHLDSIIRAQYFRYHPVKQQPKKSKD